MENDLDTSREKDDARLRRLVADIEANSQKKSPAAPQAPDTPAAPNPIPETSPESAADHPEDQV